MPQSLMDEEIARQVQVGGFQEDVAARFVRAMCMGGLVEYEAFQVIRDRDCSDGVAHDVVHIMDLPSRWFRSAWRRSHNGGPISIDIREARRVQWRRIMQAIEGENKRRLHDIYADPIAVDTEPLRTRIMRCEDLDHMAMIWPEGVPYGIRSQGH